MNSIMSALATYKLSEILASADLQAHFRDEKDKNWNHITLNCNTFPIVHSTIYIKLDSSIDPIRCIGLIYTGNHTQGSTLVHDFLSKKMNHAIITSNQTFQSLCSQGKVLSEPPLSESSQSEPRQYTIAATLVHRSRGSRSETKNFAFSPDTKISDVSKNVFIDIFGKADNYNVIFKINNIPCEKDKTLKDYEQMLNQKDSTFTIYFSDATYGSLSHPEGQYTQKMSGGRSKKSRRTRHKKRSFKRKLRKTRR